MPEFVLEDGYLGAKLAEQIQVLTGMMPVFRAKKDSLQIQAFTPLQAADILVYEMSQLNQGDMSWASFSHPFQELNRMPGGILRPPRHHRLRPST